MGVSSYVKKESLLEEYNNKCVWCQRELWEEDLNIEHLCPKNQGGQSSLESGNLLLACVSCNSERKSKSAVAFAKQKEEEETGISPDWDTLRKSLKKLSRSGVRKEREYAKKQLRHFNAAKESSKLNV